MSGQRFFASDDTFTWPNGAVGHRPGGPFDCLGPYAKVRNCPIDGTDMRRTCYATGYADTFFSIPARFDYKGKMVKGYFAMFKDPTFLDPDAESIYFRPLAEYKDRLK